MTKRKPKIYASIEDNGRGEYQVAWHEGGASGSIAVYWNSAACHDTQETKERFIHAYGADFLIQWC